MSATFDRLKIWQPETLTNEDLNDEIDNILENLGPVGIGDYSANASQMGLQTDPGTLGSEDLAESLAGELERLRYVISRVIFGDDVASKKWYEEGVSSIQDLFDAFQEAQAVNSANRVVSGRTRGSSSKLIALVPAGNQPQVIIAGQVTPFVYSINGTQYSITSNLALTIPTAPSSNNTALASYSNSAANAMASTYEQTKYMGEYGSHIFLGTVGTEITSRLNIPCAFKNGSSDEVLIATPLAGGIGTDTHKLVNARRGFFFDSLDFPLEREGFNDGATFTLLQLSYIFAKADGTVTSTIIPPTRGAVEPVGVTNKYWFDTVNNIWKRYNGAAWADATATIIGYAVCDANFCIGARALDAEVFQNALNTITELRVTDTDQVLSVGTDARISVNGSTNAFSAELLEWNTTDHLASDTALAASMTLYLYVTENGSRKMSKYGPYDRRNDLLGWYHPYDMWRCVGQCWYNSSSEIVNTQAFEGNASQAFAITHELATATLVVRLHAPASKPFTLPLAQGTFAMAVPGELKIVVNGSLGNIISTQNLTGSLAPSFYIHLCDVPSNGQPELGVSYDLSPSAVAAIGAGATGTALYIANNGYALGTIKDVPRIPVGRLVASQSAALWDTLGTVTLITDAMTKKDEYNTQSEWFMSTTSFPINTAGFASGEYAAASANSMYLPAGTYEVEVLCRKTGASSIGAPASVQLYICAANGANTGSLPSQTGITVPTIGTTSAFPVGQGYVSHVPPYADYNGNVEWPYGKLYFTLAAPLQIYLVMRASFGAANDNAFQFRATFKRRLNDLFPSN